MNKERRKRLNEIHEQLSDISGQLEEVLGEEQEYVDSIPENLQSSERYELAEKYCGNLEETISDLDNVLTMIEETMN